MTRQDLRYNGAFTCGNIPAHVIEAKEKGTGLAKAARLAMAIAVVVLMHLFNVI